MHLAQPLLLAGDHVAAAEHQIGLPGGNQLDGPQHLGQVAGGAVTAVEITDSHQAQVAPGGLEPTGIAGGRPGGDLAGRHGPHGQTGQS